ncbi:MAG: NEW3 domain-containing protein, partial [bacterium]
ATCAGLRYKKAGIGATRVSAAITNNKGECDNLNLRKTANALIFCLLTALATAAVFPAAPAKGAKPANAKVVKVAAKSAGANLSKETQLKLLKLDEARASLQTSQDLYDDKSANLKDMQELYKQDVVTGKEVSDANTDVKDATRNLELARIELAKTALSFLQDVTHVSIAEAFQYIDPQNKRHMSVTLRNDSDLDLAVMALGEGVPEANITKANLPALLTIENLYAAVKNGSTIIGAPYEIKISKLPLGKETHLDFMLNAPAEEVALSMKYHNIEDVRSIYLEKKSAEDIVRVSAQQFAQEGQLGSSVEYTIDNERLAEDERTFTLGLVGLPNKYRYKYTDKGTQLSQVKFSQGSTKISLGLRITVPDELPDSELRKPIRFYTVIGDEAAVRQLENAGRSGREISPEQFQNLKVGFERLELTPLGTGKFEISLSTLYYEIKKGDNIAAKMTVKNTGSVRLDNITYTIEKPEEWNVTIDPDKVESIEPGKEIIVRLKIEPPAGVDVGAYEVKVEGSTLYEGGTIKSDQKDIRIQLTAKTNLTLSLSIAGGLIFFIIGIAIVIVKLSRR